MRLIMDYSVKMEGDVKRYERIIVQNKGGDQNEIIITNIISRVHVGWVNTEGGGVI